MDLQEKIEDFYQYFDEDFAQWDLEELESVYSELTSFLSENSEELDKRNFTDLYDVESQLNIYLVENYILEDYEGL